MRAMENVAKIKVKMPTDRCNAKAHCSYFIFFHPLNWKREKKTKQTTSNQIACGRLDSQSATVKSMKTYDTIWADTKKTSETNNT